jgi:hypothetical protein
MALTISTQKVDTWKKRIQKHSLKCSTYFCQQGGSVWVSALASVDHQAVCKKVLSNDSGNSSLVSYHRWDDVSSIDLVELLYQLEQA